MRPAWAEVDLGAIERNVVTLRARLSPGCRYLAVVKANAYGHGDIDVAHTAIGAGAEWLGVILVSEGRRLRERGIDTPILLMHEPHPTDADETVALELTPCVSTEQGITALDDAAGRAGRKVPVHLKVDTGLNRFGVPVRRLRETMRLFAAATHLEIEGVLSHLACADQPDHPFIEVQLSRFLDVLDRLRDYGVEPRIRHLANSAAAIAHPDAHFDMVRIGIATYGLSPGVSLRDAVIYEPALTLKALVARAVRLRAGEGVSYGHRYVLGHESTIATVPMGYGDGWSRRLSGRACVLIGDQRHRVAGTVCMDSFMVDVGDADVSVGDEVVLIGAQGRHRITADDVAEASETINYEVVTSISSRVPRVYRRSAVAT